jgi:hypothetical protein
MAQLKDARVQDIILDKDHPRYEELGSEESIGTILFTFIDELSPIKDINTLLDAKPLYYNFSHYPVPGEIVHVIGAPNDRYNEFRSRDWKYLPPQSIFKSPSSNASPDTLDENEEFYQGRYFQEKENVRPLRPYEGDIMIEGRFGQSIRFGSTIDNEKTTHPNEWSHNFLSTHGEDSNAIGSPIMIIRNGQVGDEQGESYEHILEDINGDDSSIYLCSDQQISNFQPASLHDESYGHDIYKEQEKEEPQINYEDIPEEAEEDIVLYEPDNLPAEDLQQEDELNNLPEDDEDIAYHDIAPTENTATGHLDEIDLSNVPDGLTDIADQNLE